MIVSDTGTFTPCPAGSHIAICIGYVDLGTQIEMYEGKQKIQRKIRIMWELCEERKDDGKLFTTGKTYTNSLGDRASLRSHLEGWRGRAFTVEELKGFNLDNIVGKPCLLTIVHKPRQSGGVSDSISGITPLHRSMAAPKQVNPSVIFDIDKWDDAKFAALPQFLQAKIALSPEARAKRPNLAQPVAAGGATSGATSGQRPDWHGPSSGPPHGQQAQYGPGSHEPASNENPF